MTFVVWAVGAVCSYLLFSSLVEWAQMLGVWSWPRAAATALATGIILTLAAFGAAAVIRLVG